MDGKVCLVTGATSGHGLAVARALARRGAELIVHGRNEARVRQVRDEVAAETGREPAGLLCDLSSRADIDRAASEQLATGRPLHLLVANAGAVFLRRTETVDGVEATFGVNYLATFQLTLRLLPRLLESAPARIVVVASDAHRVARLDLDDLQTRRRFGMMKAYGRSKLALIYFTRELARRLRGTAVTVNAVDPGPVRSAIGQNNPGLAADLTRLMMDRFFPPAEEAAETALRLATSPELEGVSGGYYRFVDRREPSLDRRDPAGLGLRLWQESARLTGVDFPAPAR